MIRTAIFLAAGLLGGALAYAQGAGLLPWPQVRQKVEAHWKATYPAEKIQSIEQKGGVEYSSNQRATETTLVGDSWWSYWVTTTKEIQGSFARQVALVTVERVNKSRVRFEVAALYRGEGKQWLFDKIAVGPVTELGAPGDPGRPSDAQAADIFKQAWSRLRPDFTVGAVQVLSPPKLGSSGERRWLSYKLAIEATGTAKAGQKYAGKKARCTPEDYSSVLKWDAEKRSWLPDEGMIRNVNEDRDCKVG